MTAERIAGLVVLAAVAACAPMSGTQTSRQMIKREDGPKGFVSARYSGGRLMRTVNASFRTEEDAYVIVGHLSGDGIIRVLYPESPQSVEGLLRPVRARRTIATSPFFASFDAAPALHTFRINPFRGLAAMSDSYDGRGHGYVFMIATRSPMAYEAMTADDVEWSDIPVRDYERMVDPRLAVRELAETVTRGGYTLKFASSFTGHSMMMSYAANAWECSLLGAYGLSHLTGFWGSWGMASFWPYYSFQRDYLGCNVPRYAFGHYYYDRPSYQYGYRERRYVPVVAVPTPTTPDPVAPDSARPIPKPPIYRPFGDRVGDRWTLDRTTPVLRSPVREERRTSPANGADIRSSPWVGRAQRPMIETPRPTRPRDAARSARTARSRPERARSVTPSQPTRQPQRASSPTPRPTSPAPARTKPTPTPDPKP